MNRATFFTLLLQASAALAAAPASLSEAGGRATDDRPQPHAASRGERRAAERRVAARGAVALPPPAAARRDRLDPEDAQPRHQRRNEQPAEPITALRRGVLADLLLGHDGGPAPGKPGHPQRGASVQRLVGRLHAGAGLLVQRAALADPAAAPRLRERRGAGRAAQRDAQWKGTRARPRQHRERDVEHGAAGVLGGLVRAAGPGHSA